MHQILDSCVAVMKAAKHGLGNDATKALDWSAEGRVLASDRCVRASV
jgi:hypothetical protein